MSVLLVQPRVGAERAYPLGLATLIPGLNAAGHEVLGCDLSDESLSDLVRKVSRVDLVGFHLPSVALSRVREAVRAIRARGANPALPVVVGGPHATLFPEEALDETGADAAVAGEAEVVFPRVVAAALAGETPVLPGVHWSTQKSRSRRPPPPLLPDLDQQPFADRTVFPIRAYTHAMRSAAVPYTPVVSSRGCRRSCAHCPAPALHPEGFRARSPEHVHGELEWLARRHGVRCVHFEDDDFFADRARVEALCDRLCSTPPGLVWEVVNGVPPERLDPVLLDVIARAGCRSLVLSVEIVADDRSSGGRVGAVRTGYPAGGIRDLVEEAARRGITVGGYFIIGMPGQPLTRDMASIRASYGLGLARADYSIYQWIPGSAHWRDRAHLAFDTGNRTAVRLLRLVAQFGFYLRPGPFRALLADLRRQPAVLGAVVSKVLDQVVPGTRWFADLSGVRRRG